jgi:hypothetical protein
MIFRVWLAQRCVDLRQKLSRAALFDGLDRLGIYPCRATVAAHPLPCFPQNVTPVDPVIQRMETRILLCLAHI